MPRTPEDSRAITAGKWLLAFVVPASAQALGSIPVAALLVMSAVAAVATALLWLESDVPRSSATGWVLIAFGILLGWTILQAIPLPSSVTHALTPANADIWDRALSPLREPAPAWHSLSVAPTATRVEVLRGFFYGCIFLSALRVVALERGQPFLVRVVVFAACAMALSSLAHTAVGAEKIFGVYRPRELLAYRAGHFAPLLNTNHLAAYLDVGACVALGALITGRAMPRALSGSAVLVLAGTSVWQGSPFESVFSSGSRANLLLDLHPPGRHRRAVVRRVGRPHFARMHGDPRVGRRVGGGRGRRRPRSRRLPPRGAGRRPRRRLRSDRSRLARQPARTDGARSERWLGARSPLPP